MATYAFRQMSDEDAREVSRWHYEPPYDFYDWTSDPDDLERLLDAERTYFSVFDERGSLVGFFQFESEDETVDIGLGLRPDLTGQGLGVEYLLAGPESARERFSLERFTLSVATFNERAGFRRGAVYTHNTSGADYPFLAMDSEA